MTEFPSIVKAIEISREALKLSGEKNPNVRQVLALERQAHDLERIGFATELLPAILPGEWARSKTWVGKIAETPSGPYLVMGLFDHGEMFRRKGAHGPSGWAVNAVIGQPYDALDKQGIPTAEAIASAQWLAARGVGVWANRELSTWYPGWTSLVVAARGLRPEAAAKFGFTVLA